MRKAKGSQFHFQSEGPTTGKAPFCLVAVPCVQAKGTMSLSLPWSLVSIVRRGSHKVICRYQFRNDRGFYRAYLSYRLSKNVEPRRMKMDMTSSPQPAATAAIHTTMHYEHENMGYSAILAT